MSNHGAGGSAPPAESPVDAMATDRVRKPRPERQIYRPGMMKRGTDVTQGVPSSESRPPTEGSPQHQKRPPAQLFNDRKGFGQKSNARRRSNDTDSVHSYRGGSGSTTPDAMSMSGERRDSIGSARGGARTYSRGNSRNNYDDRCSERSVPAYRSSNRGYRDYDSRTSSQMSSRVGSRDDVYDQRHYTNSRPRNQPYNSTQSLYDARQPGGYLDERDHRDQYRQQPRNGLTEEKSYGRGNLRSGGGAPKTPQSRFQRTSERGQGRSSMRAETGVRPSRGGGGRGRQRNDSITSTQSEMPRHSVEPLSVDTEWRSQGGDTAPVSTTSDSLFMAVCQSFESLGSFDWSEEVERESIAKAARETQNEEEQTRQLEKRLAACTNGKEVTTALDSERAPVRGILRINLTDSGPHLVPNRATPELRSRGKGPRQRRDSDRSSSFGGSIAEEESSRMDENEVAEGERTPTRERSRDMRWSKSGGRGRGGYGGGDYSSATANQKSRQYYNNDYGDGRQAPSGPREPRYRGGHDYEREEIKPSVPRTIPKRFEGRIQINPEVDENVGAEEKPAMVSSARSTSSQDSQIRPPPLKASAEQSTIRAPIQQRLTRDSARTNSEEMPSSSQGRQMNDFPVYQEIAANEGPIIKQLNDEVTALLPRVGKLREIESARALLECSSSLASIYYGILTRDINFTFSMNLEQHLWKQAYHKCIDVLKSAANSTKDSAKPIRLLLVQLLDSGIEFYERLVALYEVDYELTLSECLLWPNGLPADDFRSIITEQLPINKLQNSKQKVAVKSLARHLLSIGDLHRYRTLVQGSEDYSTARLWYLKAAQLWTSSGHTYNQLGVVAFFSERVLDEIYFCIRALSTSHPFEAARDRLAARMAAMRKKVDKYEELLDRESGRVRAAAELAERADRPLEFWMNEEGSVDTDEGAKDLFQALLDQQSSQLHRRTISYVIHTCGLLITKIGMESFSSVSERALCQLAALVQQPQSPVTSQQLIQIAMLYIYAVHATAIKGVDADTCSAQQQLAVRTIVTVFGVFLRPLAAAADNMGQWLNGKSLPPNVVNRVLPAICVLSEWFASPAGSTIYRTMSSLEPLNFAMLTVNTWVMLADLANRLAKFEDEDKLATITETRGSRSCVLPELVYASAFLPVFPTTARSIDVLLPQNTETNMDNLTVHLRLRQLFLAAEYLDGSDIHCFGFNPKLGLFCGSQTVETTEGKTTATRSLTSSSTEGKGDVVTDAVQPMTREELLQRERRRLQAVIVVRPMHIVVDTNAFVDHLAELQRIVDSGHYQLVIPTTVIEELLGLSQNRFTPEGEDSERAQKVAQEARSCVTWLRDQAREKCACMKTLTTQGKKLALSLVSEASGEFDPKRVNDDRILQSCTALVETSPAPSVGVSLPAKVDPEAPILHRNIVLLSEDRGLMIKAQSQKIPTRTVPSFMKWTKIS